MLRVAGELRDNLQTLSGNGGGGENLWRGGWRCGGLRGSGGGHIAHVNQRLTNPLVLVLAAAQAQAQRRQQNE